MPYRGTTAVACKSFLLLFGKTLVDMTSTLTSQSLRTTMLSAGAYLLMIQPGWTGCRMHKISVRFTQLVNQYGSNAYKEITLLLLLGNMTPLFEISHQNMAEIVYSQKEKPVLYLNGLCYHFKSLKVIVVKLLKLWKEENLLHQIYKVKTWMTFQLFKVR